ncbi:outer membrane beta-barrel protein [Vibrio pectenicida]|uniref:Outer membrane beta-barrel protein n=1 Tax=Vibrio pectenicida TaxID=62763 RepID=A0A7Y4A0L3_9VIBR|nr:outer membrane beta-barrel protein [Vibrio pectenicida]NOH72271.1 outer membrane beta-barrel protein [Vibrio pectenicida]
MDVNPPYILLSLTLLCVLPVSIANASNNFNYNYLYADLSAGSFDDDLGTNSNVTSLAVGGKKRLDKKILATIDYEARFIHPNDNTTTENYTLLPGVAFYYSLEDKWDLMVGAKTGYVWSSSTNDITDEKLFSDGKFMWVGNVTLKHELTQHWQVSFTGELRRSDILDEDIFNMRAGYQVTDKIVVAGFYTHRNNGKTTTNEGGISVKYLY